MSCRDSERRLGPFVDGELPATESERVLAHVAGCSRCASTADRLRGLEALAAGASVPPVSDHEWAALRRRVEGLGEQAARGEKVISFPERASPLRLLPACAAAALIAGMLFVSGGPVKKQDMTAEDPVPAAGPQPEVQVDGEATLLQYFDF
jgi:anti-sigma factor RsiW